MYDPFSATSTWWEPLVDVRWTNEDPILARPKEKCWLSEGMMIPARSVDKPASSFTECTGPDTCSAPVRLMRANHAAEGNEQQDPEHDGL